MALALQPSDVDGQCLPQQRFADAPRAASQSACRPSIILIFISQQKRHKYGNMAEVWLTNHITVVHEKTG